MAWLFRVVMSLLCLVATAHAADTREARVHPSDCRPRDADSTCATAVAAATPPPFHAVDTLYDGPLGGVPAHGFAYWGYDFIADQTGTPSPVRQDEYINRSGVDVLIKLSFDIPSSHPCNHDCLPGVEFEMGPGWGKVDPPYIKDGNVVSLSATVRPGEGYGWIIGLWEATNPRLTVTVPKGSAATLAAVGLVRDMPVANEIPPDIARCQCDDGTFANCSAGEHFSNGLLGIWTQGNNDGYDRAGAFNDCAFH